MDIRINEIKIFKDNLSTLRQTSLDDNGTFFMILLGLTSLLAESI